MKIAEIIKRGRSKMGFTQEAVAQKIGVSRVSISEWERGEKVPSGEALIKLVSLLGLYHEIFPDQSIDYRELRQHITAINNYLSQAMDYMSGQGAPQEMIAAANKLATKNGKLVQELLEKFGDQIHQVHQGSISPGSYPVSKPSVRMTRQSKQESIEKCVHAASIEERLTELEKKMSRLICKRCGSREINNEICQRCGSDSIFNEYELLPPIDPEPVEKKEYNWQDEKAKKERTIENYMFAY